MKNKNFDLTVADLTPGSIISTDLVSNGDEVFIAAGAYAAQDMTAFYNIKVTKAGAYGVGEVTVTCKFGAEDGFTQTLIPVSGVVFNVGTIGVTATLTDGGDGVLTLNDEWEAKATGTITLVDIEFGITKRSVMGVETTEYFYPTHILCANATGDTIGLILLSKTEGEELNADPTLEDEYYAFIEVPNNSPFSDDWGTLPLSRYIGVQFMGAGVPGAALKVQMIGYVRSR